MSRAAKDHPPPDWEGLLTKALERAGLFSAAEARLHNIGTALLRYAVTRGRVEPFLIRGIYRFTAAPQSNVDQLYALWIWSGEVGVFSHETALRLHELSDVLPARVHLTLPAAWQKRRLRVPKWAELFFYDLERMDTTYAEGLPVTTPLRTIRDTALLGTAPEQVEMAMKDGLHRGLFTRSGLTRALKDTPWPSSFGPPTASSARSKPASAKRARARA
ncbi:MAG: hypothetical protein JNK72_24725 [Myxococcales bacterium]|nr:hypothetical protein [Myxococcales bacterium]